MSSSRERWQARGKAPPRQISPPKPIAPDAAPTWGQGDRTDWEKENRKLIQELKLGPKDLQRAWGPGGSQGTRGV